MVFLFLVLLHKGHLLPILVEELLLVPDHITKFHLLLNQVLSLGKGANELLSFFLLHCMASMLVPNIHAFQVFLFVLQLNLLVTKLFSQTLLFLI
jgi:hypothetical protein